MEASEIQAILNCQSGNLKDFGILYDKYIEKIYSFVFFRVNHKESTQDIVSDVFFKALNKINRFDMNKASFSTWLYSIARNSVIDYYRGKKSDISIDDLTVKAEDSDVESEIDCRLKLDEIKKYLDEFSPLQQEIITMRIWDELSYKEIKQVMNMSEGALKMTVARILKKIRKDPKLVNSLLCFFL